MGRVGKDSARNLEASETQGFTQSKGLGSRGRDEKGGGVPGTVSQKVKVMLVQSYHLRRKQTKGVRRLVGAPEAAFILLVSLSVCSSHCLRPGHPGVLDS